MGETSSQKHKNKVLVILYDFFTHHGGASRVAKSVAEMLIDNGWDVHVLTADNPVNSEEYFRGKVFSYNFDNSTFSLPTGKYLQLAFNLWRKATELHKIYRYNAVHAHHYLAGLTISSFKYGKEKGVNTVFTCHGIRKKHFSCYNQNNPYSTTDIDTAWHMGIEASMTEAMHILETQSICNSAAVTCVSNYLAQEIRSEWEGVKPIIIPNFYCIDVRRNRPIAIIKNKIAGKKRIIFVGRWEKTKGCDIVEGIARKLSTNDNFVFIHAGLLIEPAEPSKIIHLGHLADSQLLWLYRKADMMLMPSRYEPFGLTAIEAITNGTPVMAHRVGGLTEVINEGKNGWLLPNINIDSWVSKILEYFSPGGGPLSREQVSNSIDHNFTKKKSLELYSQLFNQITLKKEFKS